MPATPDHEPLTWFNTASVGVLVMPHDILPAPRTWGERWLNVVHWTESESGGHFAAWERPNLFVDGLVAFQQLLA